MPNNNKFINIGIVAHVDAGKTSITEMALHKGGTTKVPGNVDKGTSVTDWLDVERERGISVRSATASVKWNDINFNIIDTPGHIDFSSEVERILPATDCILLIISAVESVQSHTIQLWQAIKKLKKPSLIFINKIDRTGSDIDNVLNDIKKELALDFFTLQNIINEGTSDAKVVDETGTIYDNETFTDEVISRCDELMIKYLNGDQISNNEIVIALKNQINTAKVSPVLFGSAKLDIGITELMNFIADYFIPAKGNIAANPSGVVYKVEHDDKLGKIASVRLFNGELNNRDIISINGNKVKITQIGKLIGPKFVDTGNVVAGDTAAVLGLTNIIAGDFIGDYQPDDIIPVKLNIPLLTVKVEPNNNTEYSNLVSALQLLNDEDPTLDLSWLKDEHELNIHTTGTIHIEILKSTLLNRFNLEANFSSPTVIYKETPIVSMEVMEEYTMPKPCWAIVRFLIEPLAVGAGVMYNSIVGVNEIAIQYQKEVERTIPQALSQGIHGWEVTDVKITLIGDEDHNVHSRAGDFAVATNMAIMKGLNKYGTKLLEPVLDYQIQASEDLLGVIVSELTQLRAEIGIPELYNNKFTLKGIIPLSTSLDFPIKFNSLTGGKGKYISSFNSYRECELKDGKTTAYRGVNPLDRSKYILKARKALQ